MRLAIVCSGGISLAVYMHGIAKEILKLARASKLYHSVHDAGLKRERSFADLPPSTDRIIDTEAVYFDLLREIGAGLDLRVIVDVIAGASAGGINSVLLARALAHDLPFDDLRDMWLTGADVESLISEGSTTAWSDRLFWPLVRWIAGDRLDDIDLDDEVEGKLRRMMQIVRLRPPFDGERLVDSLINAMEAMGAPRSAIDSLVPTGLKLDMFVTLTDFFGYERSIPLYDPPLIEEREHRHRLHFRYRRWVDGQVETDFDMACIPALAFAARATASFPAAFPPAQLGEVDRVLDRRGRTWTNKEKFLRANFRPYFQAGTDPEKTSFLDGSVLNNKPFAPAIDAIGRQPAYRRVDRRLVYINPSPANKPPPPTGKPPGVLRTLKAALSDIPRNEPIADDLDWVQELNRRTRSTRHIIEAARPDIVAAVEKVTRGKLDRRRLTDAQIAEWRTQCSAEAAKQAGFAYKGYQRLKLQEAVDQAAKIVGLLCGQERGTVQAEFIEAALHEWAAARGVLPAGDAAPQAEDGPGLPAWVKLLRTFDLEFRSRRIRFVIQELNALYGRLDPEGMSDLTGHRLDSLKGRFYEVLDALRSRDGTAAVSLEAAGRTRDVFGPILSRAKFDGSGGAAFARDNLAAIDAIVTGIARDIDLESLNRRSDEILSGIEPEGTAGTIRRDLLIHYLGFSFWDMVTFSAGMWDPTGNYNEIRIARLSPQDCTTIRSGGPEEFLKGVKLGNFGAFFKRAHRENDYIWGRLHGADRLIDIVVDAARVDGAGGDIDSLALKRRAFRIILDAEKPFLKESAELIAELEREVEALAGQADQRRA
ncbi:patatin-like protein [Emcibacter sp. SYSU 3D8]|uniref:patatin-like protein n=1 Tax=Emcibacter sp. SYSU 3D8 TaxID=3133969 RepID=UPI0031FEB52B